MSGDSVVKVHRRGRAEIAQLASLYPTSGLNRSEFCRRHGMAISTLNRCLSKASKREKDSEKSSAGRSSLVEVELAKAEISFSPADHPNPLTVLLPNNRRVEVNSGFDQETLVRLVAVLECM
jgi:hypothetical protein